MSGGGSIIVFGLMIVTAIVLVIGIIFMARGGEANAKYSNKLMSLRVLFQALAIAAVALLLLIKQKSG